MITSTRKIVYRLHDQAEDKESKSLPIINTLRNMTVVLYKNYKQTKSSSHCIKPYNSPVFLQFDLSCSVSCVFNLPLMIAPGATDCVHGVNLEYTT